MNFQFINRNFKHLGAAFDCDHNLSVHTAFLHCRCRSGTCFGNENCNMYHRRRECGIDCKNPTCENQNLQWFNPSIRNHVKILDCGAKGYGLFVFNVDWEEHTVLGSYDGEVMDQLRYEQYCNHGYDQSYICKLGPRAYVNALHYRNIARYYYLY